MITIFDYYTREDSYPDLNAEAAVEHLSRAVSFKTVTESPAEGAFDGLIQYIKDSFPNIMKAGSFERFRNSVLITVKGSDSSLKPALYMSHLDVVPVVPGTEKDWIYDAFSGQVADGYIWGRGTADIKQQVFGYLEALDYILSKGKIPKRTVYLAFGDDEETFNTGSRMIAEELQRRGAELEYLLDEGGGKLYDAGCFGAPGLIISDINLMEKGYADLELSVESKGGHSSKPFGGTSLGILAGAISAICSNPFPNEINPLMQRLFSELKPFVTDQKLQSLLGDNDTDALAEYCSNTPELFPYVTTTIAPTVIEGGSRSPNVMPQNMRAVINFRLNYGCTPEDVFKYCRELVDDPRVSMRFLQANSPSKISNADSYGYRTLKEVLNSFYENVKFVPLFTAGATDARSYEIITDSAIRFSPFFIPDEDLGGVHGTNERILIRSYIHGIRVLIALMDTNF